MTGLLDEWRRKEGRSKTDQSRLGLSTPQSLWLCCHSLLRTEKEGTKEWTPKRLLLPSSSSTIQESRVKSSQSPYHILSYPMFPSLLITKEIRGVCRGWEAQPHHNTKRYTMLPLCFVSFRSVPASLSLEQVSPVRSCPSSLYYYTTLHYTMPYCTTIYSNYLSYRLFIYRRSLQYLCNAMI